MLLVFATSGTGGAGRSVTSGNIAYRCALNGEDVCYLDFDFGSPTAGAAFTVEAVRHGAERGGVHSYLAGQVARPMNVDVFAESDRLTPYDRLPGSGRLHLMPGDRDGGEFSISSVSRIANPQTAEAFTSLARRLTEPWKSW